MECVKALFLEKTEGADVQAEETFCYPDMTGIKYENTKWNEIKRIIEDNDIDAIIASEKDINIVSRLFWECRCLKRYYLTDTDDALLSEKTNDRANALMWDVIAKRSVNDNAEEGDRSIKQTGWINSFTGNYFSDEEMKEYAENTYSKLKRYCKKSATVLEIGVASGITCFTIAPLVKKYIGIDISKETLKCTQKVLEQRKIDNVTLLCGDAGNLSALKLSEKIDVVIINSVAQYFAGYNYFINIIKSLIPYMSDDGVIFIGDVMDLSKRKEFQEELFKSKKKSNKNDLYYPKDFMEEIPAYVRNIVDIEISEKIGKIKNELTLYRYDVLFVVDKNRLNTNEHKKMGYAIG